VTAPATTPQPTQATRICFQDSPRDWAEPWSARKIAGKSRKTCGRTASASPNATIALAGLSHHPYLRSGDLSAVNRKLVLGNQVIVGTVNAARRHYDQAAQALARADPGWLARLLTRQVPMASWPEALAKEPDDIKVTVALDDDGA